MRRYILLLMAFVCACCSAQDLGTLIESATTFDNRYPRETVYLHTDNAAYIQGDTLWYKAYVVRVSSLRPDSTLSRTLYVELLNDAGTLLQRSILRLDSNGQANGHFALTPPLQRGFYELRAYTRAMTNWFAPSAHSALAEQAVRADDVQPERSSTGTGYFSKVFPLFELPKKALPGDFSQLDIQRPESELYFKLPHERPYDFGSTKERRIEFFPEGGKLTKGVGAHVAFRLTDGKGMPANDSIAVFSAEGRQLCLTAPEHEGMGTFFLPAAEPGAYAQVLGSRGKHLLPHPAASAIALHAYRSIDDETATPVFNLDMQPAAGMLTIDEEGDEIPLRVAVVVFSREIPHKVYPLELYSGELTTLAIDISDFSAGVNRLEVISAEGQPLASRLVYIEPTATASPQVVVRQNEASYEAFCPIAIEVELRDEQGHPMPNTEFSISVRDERGDLIADSSATLSTQLNLCSQLRGYVDHPAAYLATTDAASRALDLLLQVQGWNPETMAQLCMADSFSVRQPMEDYPVIRGRIIEDNERMKPYADIDLSMTMYNQQWHVMSAQTKTDGEGVFAFESHEDFTGDFTTEFHVRDAKGKDVWHRTMIDQWFGPRAKKYDVREMSLLSPPEQGGADTAAAASSAAEKDSASVRSTEANGVDLFVWPDTIPRTVSRNIGEVEVRGKKSFVFELIGKPFDRYNYGGGEAQSIRHSDTYFNVDLELQRIRDAGVDVFSIRDFLCYLVGDKDKALNPDPLIQGTATDAFVTHSQTLESLAEEVSGAMDERGEITPDKVDGSYDLKRLEERDREVEEEVSIPERLTVKGQHFYVVVNNRADLPENQKNMQMPEQLKSVIVSYDAAWATQLWAKHHGSRQEHLDGIIYVHTRPDWYNYKQVKGVQKRTLHGLTPPADFHGPDYRRTDPENDADYRRTLYWNPCLTTDAEGKATAIFYANARWRQQLHITVRGITPDGRIIEYDR